MADRAKEPWAVCSWKGDKPSIVYTFSSHKTALAVMGGLRAKHSKTPYSIEHRESLAARGVANA